MMRTVKSIDEFVRKEGYRPPRCVQLQLQLESLLCLSTVQNNIVGWESDGSDGQLETDL